MEPGAYGHPGIVSLGQQVNLADGVKYFGAKNIVAGNLDTSLVASGAATKVYEAAKKCILAGKDAPNGYIFMTACETPSSAPPYNFYMLTKAINDYGYYD
jgi:uroporphyrinogen-III decarboxylase